MSRRNERNQAIRRGIHHDVYRARELWVEGRRDEARRLMESASQGLSQAPWNGGTPWADARQDFCSLMKLMKGPCDCWCCKFTKEQREQLRSDVEAKAAQLSSVYSTEENNLVGAFAEAVFALRYGLPLNRAPGFDGGKDFHIDCPWTASGLLTIDVKGTTYVRISDEKVTGMFPHQEVWNTRDDHIYVLLQVIELEHVYFRGFAFGNDTPCPQIFHTGEKKRRALAISPTRTLDELEFLLGAATPALRFDDSQRGTALFQSAITDGDARRLRHIRRRNGL